MKTFELKRLYDPQFTHENRLPPRASIIPSLHKGVFFKNKGESELILDLNGDYKFSYREKDDQINFSQRDFDDSCWDTLRVPSMWRYQGNGIFNVWIKGKGISVVLPHGRDS